MVVINVAEQGIATQIRKKLGNSVRYGKKIYGRFKYGEEETLLGYGQYGILTYSEQKYGEVRNLYGIYRIRHKRHKYFVKNDKERGTQYIQKEAFHCPSNPQTGPQQANRQKYADAITAWQGLTNNQKEIYNERARYKPYSGYNLYIREYILSH